MRFWDAAADLLVEGCCPGCQRAGAGLCPACVAAVAAEPVRPFQRHCLDRPGWSAGLYADPLRRLISQAKDHHRWDAIGLLSSRLAAAVAGLADAEAWPGPLCLTPIVSSPQAVRQRGLDLTWVLAKRAAARLRGAGLEARAWRGLVQVRRVRDQGGLDFAARQANLSGSMAAARPPEGCRVVLVDDVVTTGASLAEGVRALRRAGCPAPGLATIAATVLTFAPNLRAASTFSALSPLT